MKAEDLYNRHLAKETIDDQRWAVSISVTFVIYCVTNTKGYRLR